jgi:hypothetical protein
MHPTAGLALGLQNGASNAPYGGGSGVGAAKRCIECTLRLHVRRRPQNGALNAPYGYCCREGLIRLMNFEFLIRTVSRSPGFSRCAAVHRLKPGLLRRGRAEANIIRLPSISGLFFNVHKPGCPIEERLRIRRPQNGASQAPYGGSGVGLQNGASQAPYGGFGVGLQNGTSHAPYGGLRRVWRWGRKMVQRMHPTAARPPPAAKRCIECTLRRVWLAARPLRRAMV